MLENFSARSLLIRCKNPLSAISLLCWGGPLFSSADSGYHGARMRVLVISDIHANREALDTVLGETKDQRDAIWCLGDVVGYGAAPDYCVQRMREEGALVVAGNHDVGAAGKIGLDLFSPVAAQRLEWTRREISEETKLWLASLPERRIEMAYTLLHGSPTAPVWDYVLDGRSAAAAFAAMETPGGFNGHTHVPAIFSISWRGISVVQPAPGRRLKPRGRMWLANPGSCGVPRDGDNRASYLLFDTERERLLYCRVEYPFQKSVDALRECEAPRTLIDLIKYGS